ncbi:uncharacterized protein LOC141543988 [Sminthopsis crassicaudata]|uniref:uncharacterized protein LOC141543988 n=1 Tax=Sminthopsis crassicaudata TaxID=9301 RepID=UPI003D68EED3
MKKIFDFFKKEQFPPGPSIKLPDFFGVESSSYVPGYVIHSKDLRKIHKAALSGNVAKVQHLLLLGKNNVNDLDKEKRTSLHLACANGHPDVVSLLVERKCELDLLDKDSRTPLMKAIQCCQEECATILLEHGADPNLGDNCNNALHYVAYFQNIDMAAKLLQYKADIEAKNKEGLTPLFFAVRANNCDMADFLLKNGANVNALDAFKRTALMIAISLEFTEMVSVLLQHNADHTIKDQMGRTAEKYARIYNYPRHIYHKQIEQYKPSPLQISDLEKAYDTGFVLGAPSLDQKVVSEESSSEDSIERLFEKPGPDDSWPSMDDEISFEKEKQPKLNLTKIMNAAQQIRNIREEKISITYTKVTPFLGDNESLSDIEDIIDSFPKSSSQAQGCSHPVHPPPAYFSKSSFTLMKSTLLDILNENSSDSEEEEKKKDVLVNNFTGKQTTCETPNIPKELQAQNTSEKCAERKEDDKESPWDSEEYLPDSDVKKKKNILAGNNTGIQKTSENPNIPDQLQAHGTSDKYAVGKRLDKEEDTESPWDSEEYLPDSDVEKLKNDILAGNNTGIQKTSETPNIPDQLQAHDTSDKYAVGKTSSLPE